MTRGQEPILVSARKSRASGASAPGRFSPVPTGREHLCAVPFYLNDETSAQEIGMDRPDVRRGAEPPCRLCFARPIVCSGRDDCSGGGFSQFQFGYSQGMSSRQKVLENGARQITAFHLAGDFCDLHTYVLKTLPDSVVAMTACEVAIVPHTELDRIFSRILPRGAAVLGIDAY